MDTWRESQEEVATADETSRRLAVCNMDWDHLEARDVYGGYSMCTCSP